MIVDRFQVEGTPDEVIARLKELMAPGRYYVKVSRLIDNPVMTPAVRAAIDRLSHQRTPEELEAVRKATRIFTPPPLDLSSGKTLEDVIRETGPDGPAETDEELSRVRAESH